MELYCGKKVGRTGKKDMTPGKTKYHTKMFRFYEAIKEPRKVFR